jgi:hypothetical protein
VKNIFARKLLYPRGFKLEGAVESECNSEFNLKNIFACNCYQRPYVYSV